MVRYEIRYHKDVIKKDLPNLKAAKLEKKAKALVDLLGDDPFTTPPFFEQLVGDLEGYYSRRINHKHRLVYQVHEEEKILLILSMWSHYEKNL